MTEEKIYKLSLLLSRTFAFVVDNLIILIILLLIFEHFQNLSQDNLVSLILLILLSYEIYFFLFEILFSTTPGKKLFGINLRLADNYNDSSKADKFKKLVLRFREILIRNLTRVLVFTPPLFLLNEFLFLFFLKGRTVRDVISNTEVDFSKRASPSFN